MNDWFRSWHGAPTDPKWLVIAKRASVAPGIVSAIVWALFDHASQATDRGNVSDFDFETYAAFSGFDEEQVRAVYGAMEAKAIIISGRLSKWDKRQPRREDNSAERVKAHRKREAEPSLPLEPEPQPRAENAELVAPVSAQSETPAPDDGPAASAALVSPKALKLANEIAMISGHDPQFVPPSWCGAAARVNMWLGRGWSEPLILESVRAQIARKRDGPPGTVQYFEPELTRVHARANAPLPTVVPFQQRQRGSHATRESSITAAADRLIAELEGGSGPVCESASRLLPDGRSQ